MSETSYQSFWFAIITYIALASETVGINFYVRFELIPKFCKVEFVCFNGEPNWLGELFLFAPFFFIIYFIFSTFYWIDYLRKTYPL